MILQPIKSSSGSQWPSHSWQLRAPGRTHPGQDTVPSRASHTHPHPLGRGRVDTPFTHVCVFGMWEETGVLGEDCCGRGDDVQTPHTQWPWPGTDFFSQHGNEMMFFRDLLFITDNVMFCYLIEESLMSLSDACKWEHRERTQVIMASQPPTACPWLWESLALWPEGNCLHLTVSVFCLNLPVCPWKPSQGCWENSGQHLEQDWEAAHKAEPLLFVGVQRREPQQ